MEECIIDYYSISSGTSTTTRYSNRDTRIEHELFCAWCFVKVLVPVPEWYLVLVQVKNKKYQVLG